MKSLCKRSALASALLFSACGAQAASLNFETSDSDTIVVGATTEKVTLRVTGYKNLAPMASTPVSLSLARFSASTSSGVGSLAVTYGAEHNPKDKNGTYSINGTITNGEGIEVLTYLNFGNSKKVNIDGTTWAVLNNGSSLEGGVYAEQYQKLSVGVYPITLRAALYQP